VIKSGLWEKDRDASSKLYPLTDFKPRNDEDLQRLVHAWPVWSLANLGRALRNGEATNSPICEGQRAKGPVCRNFCSSGVRRAKAALSSGCKPHPATAPAGSNRKQSWRVTKWLKPSISVSQDW